MPGISLLLILLLVAVLVAIALLVILLLRKPDAVLEIHRTRLEQPVRLLGVSLSGLIQDPGQEVLFEDLTRRVGLLQTMDAINNRYGDFTLTWATLQERLSKSGGHPGVISPAWRPHGTRNY